MGARGRLLHHGRSNDVHADTTQGSVVRALRPARRGRRRGFGVRGLEPFRLAGRDPIPGRRGLVPAVDDRGLAPPPAPAPPAPRTRRAASCAAAARPERPPRAAPGCGRGVAAGGVVSGAPLVTDATGPEPPRLGLYDVGF